ncbi:MAG: hypothetical protein ACRDIL_19275, partial [Candidatus Limnocylindrales bacterium]
AQPYLALQKLDDADDHEDDGDDPQDGNHAAACTRPSPVPYERPGAGGAARGTGGGRATE